MRGGGVNKAVVQLYELRLSPSDLREASDEAVAMIAVFSYAVSELNSFLRLYISSLHEGCQPPLDHAVAIQKISLMRVISSKLFEFVEFLRFPKLSPTDPSLRAFSAKMCADFNSLGTRAGFETARRIRNEATSHYSFGAALKNVKHVSDRANFNMYMHRNQGNCFYPLGEEVMFMGAMNRYGHSIRSAAEREELFRIWFEWCSECYGWLSRGMSELLNLILPPPVKGRALRQKTYFVPLEIVGTHSSPRAPVFFKTVIK